MDARDCAELGVEWYTELAGELFRIKRAAGEIALAKFYCRNFALAVVGANYNFFSVFILFNIYFREWDSAVFQKILCAAAIRAPVGAVNRNGVHY